MRPHFFRTLWLGARLEWLRLRANPASWPLAGLLIAGGLIVGRLDAASFGLHSLFDTLQLAMFLTVVSAFWGWQATAAAVHPRAREVLAARAVDEWTLQGARVAVTGLYGGLITFLAFLALAVPRYYLLAPWWVGLRWLPVIVLAHTLAASLGGLAALLSVRRPGLGVPLTLGLWGAWVGLAPVFGPLWPDLFLRVLRWNDVLQDAAIEPLRWPLLVSFALATLVTLTLGTSLLWGLERRRLAVTKPPAMRSAALLGVVLALGVGLLGLGSAWAARERALTLAAPRQGSAARSLFWNPARLTLSVEREANREKLRGPARPTAVAPRDFMTFAPYIGRHGVVLPIGRVEAGRYDFTVYPSSGWELYGCSRVAPNGEGVRCAGADAEADWLLILPEGALETADRAMRALDPTLYEAKALYDASVRAALAKLERPVPEILPFGGSGSLWLGEKTLAGATVFGERALMRRQAVHEAAVTVAANLLGVRKPNEALYSAQSPLEPNVPLALVAVLDRLLLEGADLEPAEAAVRGGEEVALADRRYPLYPFDDGRRPEYNTWWLSTHDRLAQGVPEGELWAALRNVTDWNGVESWNDLLRR
ncbi:ABC transporter permease [Truepera radiovictrix]|uniref:Uncharacterized protein n=1 Tax=Truepera radiovictrix (strain DSM 17093 / CIP 108686 / LMG 22925 / RQ-24) TaxID=649638 RepID=D7CVB3_TRURR|nr:ABC transporter permease [Truepera radiovictrix]ADI14141.1 hypothetical protein Trad_1014 [Truepera radiovictrix DSM 17093]WMT57297.1 ABC transporter permease [Truepera radiovictrix]